MTGSQPKASFFCRLPSGDHLNLAIWAGKRDPEAEVLKVSITHRAEDSWESIGELSVYRTSQGNYSELHGSQPVKETQEQGTTSN
jgi:hypothetical protein